MLIAACIDKCLSYIDISLQWVERNFNHAPNIVPVTDIQKRPKPPSSAIYIWEGTASDLIELATAIHKAKLIRKPSGELVSYAELIRGLQRIFGFKIPNIYSRKTRALGRKKNASPLLERLLALYKQNVEKIYL